MFWQSFSPQALLIKLGPMQIYWYGLFLALAVLIAALIIGFVLKRKKLNLTNNKIWDILFFTIICGLFGARLWHVLFYNLPYFLANPLEILKIWRGGIAIIGGVVGGLIFLFFYSRRKKQNFFFLADLLALALPFAQAIGRFGNYFNQELFGPPCNYVWCIFISVINRPIGLQNFSLFHPVFFYEAVLNLALGIILLVIYLKQNQLQSGKIFWLYILGYAVIRFSAEFFRLDSVALFWGLKWMQFFSIFLVILAVFQLLPHFAEGLHDHLPKK